MSFLAPSRGQVAKPTSFPSPTRGWFVGANLAEAPPGTAFLLQNVFPQLDFVRIRGGALQWATGVGTGTVQSLMVWSDGITPRMFASGQNKIYEVTNSGAAGAAVVSGLGSSAFISVQFVNSGGTWLVATNGIDPPQLFSPGSGWTTSPAVTGGGPPWFSHVFVHNNRLYYIQNKTLNVYYLGLSSIGGAATLFPLQGVFRFGGYLVAGAEWAMVTQAGLVNTAVFITSQGEVAVYSGTFPGDSSWTLVGTYKVGAPLGNQCIMRAGGDLLIMTIDGIVPMSKAMELDQVALENVAITQPIAPAWRNAVIARANLTGWQILPWPLQTMAVINLPKLNAGDLTQWVANSRTGAWAQYVGWDANCFTVFADTALYFGTSDGRVMQAETGGQDDGQSYTATIFPSFSDLGTPGARKQISLVRPMIQGGTIVSPQITIKVDYDTIVPTAPSNIPVQISGAQWDVARWDVDVWPASLVNQTNWVSAQGIGTVLAPVLQYSSNSTVTPDIRLTSTDVLYEDANVFG
jgi:hypothetical protein